MSFVRARNDATEIIHGMMPGNAHQERIRMHETGCKIDHKSSVIMHTLSVERESLRRTCWSADVNGPGGGGEH